MALTNNSPPSASRLRVLIVDDYPDSADAASLLLMLYGHECRTATTGQGALEQATTFDPDIVILDIGLPDITGYEVARTLRARARARPLYLAAVTGSGLPDARAQAFAAGFDSHITKPADLTKLSLIVKLAAHNEEWRHSVIKRTGGAPTIRYFDLFLLVDNEKGAVTEFPAAAELFPAAA